MTIEWTQDRCSRIRGVMERTISLGIPDIQISAVVDGETHELEMEWPHHTRSLSWVVEDLIRRFIELNRDQLGIQLVEEPDVDNCPHDITLTIDGIRYYVNIKVYDTKKNQTLNDMGAVESLHTYYHGGGDSEDPEYSVIDAIFGIEFDEDIVRICGSEYLIVIPLEYISNPGWGTCIYKNAGTGGEGKLQARYDCDLQHRSRSQFVDVLDFWNQGEAVVNPDGLSRSGRTRAVLANWQTYVDQSDNWP